MRPFRLTDLEHVICLFPGPVCETKAVEDLKAAALQAISLTVENFGAALVDNSSVYAAVSHPCCQHQTIVSCVNFQSSSSSAFNLPCWPGSYNEAGRKLAVGMALVI